jgi:hypothetical protein
MARSVNRPTLPIPLVFIRAADSHRGRATVKSSPRFTAFIAPRHPLAYPVVINQAEPLRGSNGNITVSHEPPMTSLTTALVQLREVGRVHRHAEWL